MGSDCYQSALMPVPAAHSCNVQRQLLRSVFVLFNAVIVSNLSDTYSDTKADCL